MHSLTPVKAALAAAVTGGVLLTGGVAAAATGVLPGAAQDTARDMLAHVGVSVPGAADQSDGNADQRGPAGVTSGTDATKGQDGATDQEHAGDPTNGHGGTVSNLAKNTPTGGVQHGATVSSTASDGKSKAGVSGKAGEHSDQSGHADQPSTPAKPTQAQGSDDHTSQAGTGQGSVDAGQSSVKRP